MKNNKLKKNNIFSLPNAGFPPLKEKKLISNKLRLIKTELSKKNIEFKIDEQPEKINEIKSL